MTEMLASDAIAMLPFTNLPPNCVTCKNTITKSPKYKDMTLFEALIEYPVCYECSMDMGGVPGTDMKRAEPANFSKEQLIEMGAL